MTDAPAGPRPAVRNGLTLTLVLAAAWLLLAGPAWWLAEARGLEALIVAAVLCLIPGWLVFAFHSQYGTAAPLGVLLGGTAGRMAAVLVGVLAVKAVRPDLATTSFAITLGVFYLLSLATETKLLLTPPRGKSSEH